MINFFRRYVKLPQGATTLVIATMLLIGATLVVMFGATYSILNQRTTSNQLLNAQAFEAAQAGVEFGIVYLQKFRTTITSNVSGGYIQPYTSSSTTNVTLSNNATFSIVYSNPVASNYNLIQVQATGTSPDGTSSRVVTQLVQFNSLLDAPGQIPVVSKGTYIFGDNATITNTSATSTIQTGGSVTLYGSAKTVLSTGTSSTAGNIKSDISQNNSGLSSMSGSDFFTRFFGASSTYISNKFVNTYTNSSSTNYNSVLNGMNGTTIWINQTGGTASLNSFTTVGSTASPVLMVVNGQLSLSGNATIYGFVYVVGSSSSTTILTDNATIIGALIDQNSLFSNQSTVITFNPTVTSNIQNLSSANYFAKVPGSWIDF